MDKKINIVWCDDQIDTLLTEEVSSIFDESRCHILKTTKTAGDLIKFLKENENIVDAVIVDLNLGKGNPTPDKKQADGFRYIHERIEDYPHIPFYLYSGRDEDFIKKIYEELQFSTDDDYFFSKNENGDARYFNKQQMPQLLDMLVEEVEEIRSRKAEYKIKQEYPEAFQAIAEFSEAIVTEFEDKGFEKSAFTKPFIDILTGNIKKETGNTLRTLIEGVYRKYSHFTPCWCSMNAIPKLLSREKINGKIYTYYQEQYKMPKYLKNAFEFFNEYVNACSHPQNIDLRMMKAVAIIGLDLIRWAGEFKNKNKHNNMFKFEEFTTQIRECVDKVGNKGKPLKGSIIKDKYGDNYWLQQNTSIELQVGDTVKIKKISADGNTEHGCEYHVSYEDWELIEGKEVSKETEETSDVVTLNPPIEGKVQSTNIEGAEILYVTSDDGQKYRIEEDDVKPNPFDANVKIEGHSGRDPIYRDYFLVPSNLWELNIE